MAKRIFLAMTCILLALQNAKTQSLSPSVVASSGGFFTAPAGMLSETVGELAAVNTLSSFGYFLTQGFQQPSDFNVSVAELENSGIHLSFYPNPNNGTFSFFISSASIERVTVCVYDMTGRSIFQMDIETGPEKKEFPVNLNEAASGFYFLGITTVQKSIIRKFQIVR